MLNQALNIANLYRQSEFQMLDENEQLDVLKSEAEMFKQFKEEINKQENKNDIYL